MKNYRQFQKLMELAFNEKQIKNNKYLFKTKQTKLLIQRINSKINEIVNSLLKSDDIFFEKEVENNKHYLKVVWNPIVEKSIKNIELSLEGVSDDIIYKIFEDGYRDFKPEIDISLNYLNKVDIMTGLPNKLKNIGLGYKIIDKLIKEYKYISFYENDKEFEISLDLKFLIDSLITDENYFSFLDNRNLLIVDKNSLNNEIKEIIKNFITKDTLIDPNYS